MCEVQPAVRSSTMTRPTEVVASPQPQQPLPAGFMTLTDQQFRTTVFQEPIELYYEICPVPICTGQWASVYKCLELSSGHHFAAKFCSKTRLGVDSRREILHEVAAMYQARGCGRVVRLHQVFETPHQFILVMELGGGGDLQGVLDNDQVPYEPDVVRFISNLLEGLAFLHDRNIAHLDIKPQNLVMTGAFPDCDIKLCDLEISRVISAGQEIREMLGTPDYVSPEILRFEPVKLSADIWSVGVLAYVLLTGFTPFGGDTDAETFRNIARAELEFPDELFEDVSAAAKDFIRRCLLKDPSGRPSPHQLLEHDWLRRPSVPSAPLLVVSPSESLDAVTEPGRPAGDLSTLRRSISKSREALSVRVSRSHLKKNISKSRERLCDMKLSSVPMRPDQFPACLRSSVSEVPDNRPPWKGAGVQKVSPGSAKAERVNTFKLRDEYQNQVAAGLAAASQSQERSGATSPSPFVRQGSLRGRRKTSTPDGSSTDLRASLRRSRNADSAVTRRSSCQEESKTLPEAGKKEGPRRTQSVSDAIMHARRNRNSRKDLLLPVKEHRSGSESVDVLADGQEMVRIRPGTFVIDMGEPAKPRKKTSIVNEEEKKVPSRREVFRKNTSVDAPENVSRHSFRTAPSVEIEDTGDKTSENQPSQRQPSPDARKLSARRPGSLPSSPRLTPRSAVDRQTSPLRQGSPQRPVSPRRPRDSAETTSERSSLQRSGLRSSLLQTRTASRPSSGEESRRQTTPVTEGPSQGLRKSSTEEDMQRLSSQDERRLQKSSTDEDVRQLGSSSGGRRSRKSPVVSRNVSSPLLLSRSPTSDLGSSELSGDDWEHGSPTRATRDRSGRPETNSVARAISRFQALEQGARQGTVSPTAGRSPAISRKFSSPVLRSPDLGRKTSSPALRSPCVTRKASSPALRSPCITRKASSPVLGAASQRERGFPSRVPGLRAA
ncbi:MAP/microtubule affinity-regulating kinase 3-like [Amphibalanus amphitrite]|uniref:MAP/microtubule affinity-regulating kinase 3-like n=1 Tax=Amphibalanus amphitrite TaxID=1232801 RepID=UPI001C90E408|nr:MAP/microtubule affinity-regulating kinase 3-like [Amphibalanus amphitrite]